MYPRLNIITYINRVCISFSYTTNGLRPKPLLGYFCLDCRYATATQLQVVTIHWFFLISFCSHFTFDFSGLSQCEPKPIVQVACTEQQQSARAVNRASPTLGLSQLNFTMHLVPGDGGNSEFQKNWRMHKPKHWLSKTCVCSDPAEKENGSHQ